MLVVREAPASNLYAYFTNLTTSFPSVVSNSPLLRGTRVLSEGNHRQEADAQFFSIFKGQGVYGLMKQDFYSK
jgi:hypothetical protein